MAEPEDDAPPVLLPCSICSRTFKPESLAKHIKVCERQLTKRRKVFDSSKQRIQGTELAEFLPNILLEKKNEKVITKKRESKWKEKHLEFVRAIRAARGVESEPIKSSSALPPSRSSNHEKCPHCDRNFGPKAFDRHIEWCKEQKARIPKSPASLQAKERLEARTKYRAPPLAKSKRTLTREKYARVSQHSSQELSPMGSRSATAFSKPPPTLPQDVKVVEASSKLQGAGNKPKVSISSSSCVLPSGTSQMKRREPSASPSRRPVRSGSKTPKKGTVKSKKEETNNSDSLFTSSCSITKIQPLKERLKGKEGKPNPMENSSSEVYDPYVSAEKQMMELLSQGDFVHQPHHKKSSHPSQTETSTVFPSFESSHRSAFVRYSPQDLTNLTNESVIPSSLIAEFEDLFIAGTQKSNYMVDNSAITDEPNQNIPITLSSIGLNLTNNNVEIAQTNRKPSKIRAKMESAALSLQRSVSLMNYENDMKVGTEASNLIQSDEDSNPLPVLSEFPSFSFSSPEPHTFPSSKSYLQKGDADKKAVEDKFELKSDHSIGSEFFAQPKCHSAGGKFSADSAYGSLTRRSPTFSGSKIPGKNEIDIGDSERLCFMSSSSSESSLPPLCTVQVVKHEASNPSLSQTSSPAMDASPVSQSVPRMSKFCHECGSKYPVSLAKFCCECGVRRLAM